MKVLKILSTRESLAEFAKKKLFTLIATKISIKSATADDNRKYLYKRTARKFYY